MTQTATEKKIAPAWDAAFACLKGWQPWTSKIVSFVETDEDRKRFLKTEPNLSRLPMVSASWDVTNPRWWVYSEQEWKCPFRVEIYVPSDRNRLAMDLAEDVIDAVYRFEAPQSTNAGPVPLLKSLLCRDPEVVEFQPGTFVEAGEGGMHKLLMSHVVFSLTVRKDPKLRAR